jgi:hypothetical protein
MLSRTKETAARELPQKMKMSKLQQGLYRNFTDITLQHYSNERYQFDLKNHRFGILSALTMPASFPPSVRPLKTPPSSYFCATSCAVNFLEPRKKSSF